MGLFKRMNMHFMIIFRDGNVIILLYRSAAAAAAATWLAPKPNRRFINYRENIGQRRELFCLSDLRLFRVGRTLYEERIAALHARPFTDGSQVTKRRHGGVPGESSEHQEIVKSI